MSLLATSSLTIQRKVGEGYTDLNGNYVEEVNTTTFSATGNIQPIGGGLRQLDVPEGIRAAEIFVFRSKDLLYTTDDQSNQRGDEATRNGLTYECFSVEDWTGYGLSNTEHYKYLFIRKDKLGGLNGN